MSEYWKKLLVESPDVAQRYIQKFMFQTKATSRATFPVHENITLDVVGSCLNSSKKGENALESSHVKKMDFDSDLMIIRGEILASMKNKSYMVSICFVVSIELEKNGNISSAACSCLRGIKCYHIATLALFGHYNILVMDKKCSRNAPPKPKSRPVKSAEELYPPKLYTALKNVVPEESIKKLKEKLDSFGNTVRLTWLLHEQSINTVKNFPVIEEISSKDFLEATDKVTLFKENCAIDDQSIKYIAAATIGEDTNEKSLQKEQVPS